MKNKPALILLLLSVILVSSRLNAQDIPATTEDGRYIILHADGTWTIDESEERRAAECGKYVEEGETTRGARVLRTTGPITIGSPGAVASLTIMEIDGVIATLILMPDAPGCFSDDDDIVFMFTDESSVSVDNSEDFNCDGEATAYSGDGVGQEELADALASRTLKAIAISGTGEDEVVVLLVNPLIGKIVRETVGCMME